MSENKKKTQRASPPKRLEVLQTNIHHLVSTTFAHMEIIVSNDGRMTLTIPQLNMRAEDHLAHLEDVIEAIKQIQTKEEG